METINRIRAFDTKSSQIRKYAVTRDGDIIGGRFHVSPRRERQHLERFRDIRVRTSSGLATRQVEGHFLAC